MKWVNRIRVSVIPMDREKGYLHQEWVIPLGKKLTRRRVLEGKHELSQKQ